MRKTAPSKVISNYFLIAIDLPKSPTIALKKGNSFDIKIGESQAESRARLKLKQIAQIYNDTSIVDNLKVNQHQTGSIPRSNNNSQSPNSRARSVSTKSASKLLTRTYIAPPSANVTPVNNVMPAQDRHLRERPRNKYHSIGNNLGATRDMILNPKIPGGTPKHRKLFSSASTAFINNSSMNQNSISHSHMLHLANNTKSLENSQLDGSFSTNRKENIEMIVNELTKPQESNIDNFNGYRAAFDALIDNAQNDHIQTNFNFDLLVKVKNCYDKLIEQLLGRESLAQNIYDENKEFATEFQKLSKENQRLERDMHKTNEENIKLKELLNKLNSKLPNHNNDNKADLDSYDSPLVSVQNTELINLKQVIHKQEESIKFLKFKESRMVRLLLAIKKQGFDIESIYNEEVRDKPENGSDINLKLNFPDFSLHRDSTTAPSDNSNKDALDSAVDSIDKKLRKTFSGLKSASESVPSSPVMKHANMDKNLKDKLKLDLNFLKRNQSELIPQQVVNQIPQIPKFEINEKVLNKQGVGFHDEFMSKIGEFSLSWRQAALNERKV